MNIIHSFGAVSSHLRLQTPLFFRCLLVEQLKDDEEFRAITFNLSKSSLLPSLFRSSQTRDASQVCGVSHSPIL